MTPLNFSFATCMTCNGTYFVTMFNQLGCGMMQINHRLVNMITPEYLRLSGKGGMRSVENEECGKYRVWKIRSVENAECGKCRMWKMRSVENAECVVTLTTLRIFHTPHFPHLFSTLHIFHTPHFPHSPFHTQHFPDLTFATLNVFLFLSTRLSQLICLYFGKFRLHGNLRIFFKILHTMFSFDGQYKRRRAVSLGGASKKVIFPLFL